MIKSKYINLVVRMTYYPESKNLTELSIYYINSIYSVYLNGLLKYRTPEVFDIVDEILTVAHGNLYTLLCSSPIIAQHLQSSTVLIGSIMIISSSGQHQLLFSPGFDEEEIENLLELFPILEKHTDSTFDLTPEEKSIFKGGVH